MTHSTLWLAQIQFFSGLSFMLVFLALELGLAWLLFFFRLKSLAPEGLVWLQAYRFWARVFALALVLGFAASLAMLLQFASLWPGFMEKAANVLAPLFALAIATTFVFKAGFLGGMLYGERRLSARWHSVTVAMVAVGSTLSMFFLLAAAAWTHTPSGVLFINGQYVVMNFLTALFNPALAWYGLLFVSLAFLVTASLMMAVVIGQARRNPKREVYKKVFRVGLCVAISGVLLQLFALKGSVSLAVNHQPAKAAAVAGYWDSSWQPDLTLVAWPDSAKGVNRHALTWQGGGGSWLAQDAEGRWRGLDQYSGMLPPVAVVFWSFRLLLVLLVFTLLITAFSWWRVHGKRFDPLVLPGPWQAIIRMMAPLSGLLCLLLLAYVQFGAFPFAVYGGVTFSEVFSAPPLLALSIVNLAYLLGYFVLGLGFVWLLRYTARYGVVPVVRRRRRA